MPFCYSPWTNVDISPTGEITPCCKFQKHHYNQQFDIKIHSLNEYVSSKLVNSVKQEFLNNVWPAGCERCKIEESNGIESKRQLDYTRWKNYYEEYNFAYNTFITASIAFGNTCNLKCITCSPHSSSRWQKEYFDLYNKDIPSFKFYKENFVEDFIKQAPDIVHLDIPGGEPFLSGIDEQKSLLSFYVNSGRAKNISLHYTTNAQVFPDLDWWQLWRHFREVDIQLSIDGVGARYEYIRYPASWSILLENINKYQQTSQKNIKLSVSHTVSAYNIFYLDEFFSWCYTMGLPRPWLGRVHNPANMRPGVWSAEAKTAIIEQLSTSTHDDVKKWCAMLENTDDSILFENFKENTHKLDQYRHLDFRKVCPELNKFI
jgi:MoaA/NifB/PqqE/SkfB family radical SAM enzyme